MEQGRDLKQLIEAGEYQPQPDQVARAMLRRRGVRALLTSAAGLSATDRSRPASTPRRQAA